jgi:hypothetical protein
MAEAVAQGHQTFDEFMSVTKDAFKDWMDDVATILQDESAEKPEFDIQMVRMGPKGEMGLKTIPLNESAKLIFEIMEAARGTKKEPTSNLLDELRAQAAARTKTRTNSPHPQSPSTE